MLNRTAAEKGYSASGADGPNPLFEFTAAHAPGHTLGEIIYKTVRYGARRDPNDLLKIAAWAYLVWRF